MADIYLFCDEKLLLRDASPVDQRVKSHLSRLNSLCFPFGEIAFQTTGLV
jgi:hypothetical protein